jgi:acetyl-CoA C-acetyltransferase
MKRVAIVGYAQTNYEAEKRDQNYMEMVYAVVKDLFAETGMGYDQIDNIVTCSSDFLDGRTISDMAIQDAVGAHLKAESKVSADGTQALLYGYMRILSGQYRTTLVTAHSKGSEGDPLLIANAAFDPVYQRTLGLDAHVVSALQARMYMEKYHVSAEQVAHVAVKNLGNGARNPLAHRRQAVTLDDVLGSPMLADPIRELEASPISDGACAVILAEEELARQLTAKPLWLQGVGYCSEEYYCGDRDLTETPALTNAAKRAYKMAGVKNPKKEIHVAEIYDAYAYQELMWTEGLGLCSKGKGARLVEKGTTRIGGRLPVNPSGGVLSAHAFFAAGLARVIECAMQLRGEAGDHQVDGASLALAHGTNGFCGQGHCVWILSNQ